MHPMDHMHGGIASRKNKPQTITVLCQMNGLVFLARSIMAVDLCSFHSRFFYDPKLLSKLNQLL